MNNNYSTASSAIERIRIRTKTDCTVQGYLKELEKRQLKAKGRLDPFNSPYKLPSSGEMPDLWRPTIKGRTFTAWVYCSQRFRDIVVRHELTNVRFEPLEEQMARFRDSIQGRLANDT